MIKLPPISYELWHEHGQFSSWRDHQVFFKTSKPFSQDKPNLLLLHGFPTSSTDWAWVYGTLKKDFNIVAPDMLDAGASKNLCKSKVILADQAEMLTALIRSQNWARLHILAHDVGVTLAQEMLARHQERRLGFSLTSITYLNGAMLPDLHRPRPAQLKLAGRLGWLYARLIKREDALAAFASVFSDKTRPTGETLENFWPSITGVNGRPALARRIRYMTERRKFADRLVGATKSATLPQQLILGLDDPVSGKHIISEFKRRLPQIKITQLAGVGHYPQIEAPDQVINALLQFHSQQK